MLLPVDAEVTGTGIFAVDGCCCRSDGCNCGCDVAGLVGWRVGGWENFYVGILTRHRGLRNIYILSGNRRNATLFSRWLKPIQPIASR